MVYDKHSVPQYKTVYYTSYYAYMTGSNVYVHCNQQPIKCIIYDNYVHFDKKHKKRSLSLDGVYFYFDENCIFTDNLEEAQEKYINFIRDYITRYENELNKLEHYAKTKNLISRKRHMRDAVSRMTMHLELFELKIQKG